MKSKRNWSNPNAKSKLANSRRASRDPTSWRRLFKSRRLLIRALLMLFRHLFENGCNPKWTKWAHGWIIFLINGWPVAENSSCESVITACFMNSTFNAAKSCCTMSGTDAKFTRPAKLVSVDYSTRQHSHVGTQPRPGMNWRSPRLVLQPTMTSAAASISKRKNFDMT
jgi:hypothetical protein